MTIKLDTEVICGGPKGPKGTLRLYEDADGKHARVEMPNGKLKRWPTSALAPARGPRVPAVRAVDPEDEGRPLAIVSLDSVIEARTGVHIERSVGSVRAPIIEQPKRLTPRSSSFLAFVRSKPCATCPNTGGWGVQAHHFTTGGMALKGNDYFCAPQCDPCHGYDVREGNRRTYPDHTHGESMAMLWKSAAVLRDEFEMQKEGRKR